MAGQPFRVGLATHWVLMKGFRLIPSSFPRLRLAHQKSLAKGHSFAAIFATPGSEVMNIGYARVSTLDQNLDLQMQTLRKAGCKKIFREKVSGASRERPEFQRMLDQLLQRRRPPQSV
jgi:Resolvase, N terminal domain